MEENNGFRVCIGDELLIGSSKLIVLDMERRWTKKKVAWKWVYVKCLNCNKEFWRREDLLISQLRGCKCTKERGRRGTYKRGNMNEYQAQNCTAKKYPENVKFIMNEEDKYKYAAKSNAKVWCKCPDCKFERKVRLDILNSRGLRCPVCSDIKKYPEKFIICLLKILGVRFKNDKAQKWSNKKRYDFYFELSGKKYIIEAHGSQHYRYSSFNRSIEEEIKNDKYKKEMALSNGIDYYYEIDCRKSDVEWIKNSILQSGLLININIENIDINWEECGLYAQSNKLKEICIYKETNKTATLKEMCEALNQDEYFIIKSLKKGKKLGLIKDYEFLPEKKTEEKVKKKDNKTKNNKKNNNIKKKCHGEKTVSIYKDGVLLGVFESAMELERCSEELFGVKIHNARISEVCSGKKDDYKGYVFSHI